MGLERQIGKFTIPNSSQWWCAITSGAVRGKTFAKQNVVLPSLNYRVCSAGPLTYNNAQYFLTFHHPWISSSGFAVWRTLVAKEPILLTNCSTLWPEFLTLVKQLWGILSKASWLCLERHLFVLSSMFIHVRVRTCVTVFDVQKILANLIWINMNLLF